jgi:hypothetical protein
VNRWLIRFDVRVAKEQYVSRRWDANAKAQYLLRPDIEWPLSVDPLVWPSVFYSETFKSPHWESYSTIEVDPAIDGGDYWLELDRMRTYYDVHRALAPGGVFVGVELLSEKEAEAQTIPYVLAGDIQCAVWLEQTIPERSPEGSTLLGYDVADASEISGLANCGYTEEEVRDLAPVWANRLNSFGLLTTLEDAVAFRQVCDERVPEHAPFWIYALWRLPVG